MLVNELALKKAFGASKFQIMFHKSVRLCRSLMEDSELLLGLQL
jgi:hypothetical protein